MTPIIQALINHTKKGQDAASRPFSSFFKQHAYWLLIFLIFLVLIFIARLFGMTLGAGGRSLFGLILFVEFLVATFAVRVKCFGLILFDFFLFGKLFLGLLTFGCLAWYFVALDASFNVVALFKVG